MYYDGDAAESNHVSEICTPLLHFRGTYKLKVYNTPNRYSCYLYYPNLPIAHFLFLLPTMSDSKSDSLISPLDSAATDSDHAHPARTPTSSDRQRTVQACDKCRERKTKVCLKKPTL